MMSGKKSSRSYDGSPVGYKKPPADGQFKKGGTKPGGSGRKKGSINAKQIIDQINAEMGTVTLNGRRQRLSNLEILLRHALQAAVRGSLAEKQKYVRLCLTLAPDSIKPPDLLLVESIPGDEGL